ncbi:MAG: hypothetical protein FJ316_12435 [SAR202 cluster bacterium]|nr:hypothetical protein [SAR202 cluster bacterium]
MNAPGHRRGAEGFAGKRLLEAARGGRDWGGLNKKPHSPQRNTTLSLGDALSNWRRLAERQRRQCTGITS